MSGVTEDRVIPGHIARWANHSRVRQKRRRPTGKIIQFVEAQEDKASSSKRSKAGRTFDNMSRSPLPNDKKGKSIDSGKRLNKEEVDHLTESSSLPRSVVYLTRSKRKALEERSVQDVKGKGKMIKEINFSPVAPFNPDKISSEETLSDDSSVSGVSYRPLPSLIEVDDKDDPKHSGSDSSYRALINDEDLSNSDTEVAKPLTELDLGPSSSKAHAATTSKSEPRFIGSRSRRIRRIRRAMFWKAWKRENLSLDMDPLTLAERVYKMKVEGLGPDSIGSFVSNYVRANKPQEYVDIYSKSKRNVAIQDRYLDQHPKRRKKKQAGISKKTKLIQEKRLDKYHEMRNIAKAKELEERMNRIMQFFLQRGVDFNTLSMEDLEKATRGQVVDDNRPSSSCTRMIIRWLLKNRGKTLALRFQMERQLAWAENGNRRKRERKNQSSS